MESMDPTRELDAFAVDAAVRPLERPSKRPRTGAGGGSDALYMGPGDTVTAELDVLRGHGTYNRDGRLVSTLSGTVQRINKLVKVQPPKARYVGEIGDIVVGRVLEVLPRRWKVDINATASATLRLDNVQLENNEQRKRTADDELQMRKFLTESDLVSAEIQEHKQDRSIMLQCRSKNGKLEAGQLVSVPPHLIKRLKHHVHVLPCGVSIVLGCNGYVWVAPPPAHPAAGQAAGGDQPAAAAAPAPAGSEVSLSTRETMCRVRNAVPSPPSPASHSTAHPFFLLCRWSHWRQLSCRSIPTQSWTPWTPPSLRSKGGGSPPQRCWSVTLFSSRWLPCCDRSNCAGDGAPAEDHTESKGARGGAGRLAHECKAKQM